MIQEVGMFGRMHKWFTLLSKSARKWAPGAIWQLPIDLVLQNGFYKEINSDGEIDLDSESGGSEREENEEEEANDLIVPTVADVRAHRGTTLASEPYDPPYFPYRALGEPPASLGHSSPSPPSSRRPPLLKRKRTEDYECDSPGGGASKHPRTGFHLGTAAYIGTPQAITLHGVFWETYGSSRFR
ncbi:hypothetical protein BDY19DRAFT_733982 [Irpex rosettiformis]|uniref:Uncharacterized protein n=1 Tax=Irpex rosettiformis TaxID=378272 RepID=A0ACB8U8M3_9APHY|nr:hypothetical protein BDY19DRAFT_733982 [Irpex rosettiformis]